MHYLLLQSQQPPWKTTCFININAIINTIIWFIFKWWLREILVLLNYICTHGRYKSRITFLILIWPLSRHLQLPPLELERCICMCLSSMHTPKNTNTHRWLKNFCNLSLGLRPLILLCYCQYINRKDRSSLATDHTHQLCIIAQ